MGRVRTSLWVRQVEPRRPGWQTGGGWGGPVHVAGGPPATQAPAGCSLFPAPQAHGQTFTFPDLFPEKKPSPEDGSTEDGLEALLEEQRQRQRQDPRRGGVPQWFGL